MNVEAAELYWEDFVNGESVFLKIERIVADCAFTDETCSINNLLQLSDYELARLADYVSRLDLDN